MWSILGNVLKPSHEEKRERGEACHLNGAFFSTSATAHLAPGNGNKVYSRRGPVRINCKLLCIKEG